MTVQEHKTTLETPPWPGLVRFAFNIPRNGIISHVEANQWVRVNDLTIPIRHCWYADHTRYDPVVGDKVDLWVEEKNDCWAVVALERGVRRPTPSTARGLATPPQQHQQRPKVEFVRGHR